MLIDKTDLYSYFYSPYGFCNDFAVDRESDLCLAQQTQKFYSQLQLIHFRNPEIEEAERSEMYLHPS